MLSLISTSKAQKKLAENIRNRRLSMALIQESLSERTGVPLATLPKFEQKGSISLESFLKFLMVSKPNFTSIDELLKDTNSIHRKRGSKK